MEFYKKRNFNISLNAMTTEANYTLRRGIDSLTISQYAPMLRLNHVKQTQGAAVPSA